MFLPANFFSTQEDKVKSLIEIVKKIHKKGQPLLIGTYSLFTNEIISKALQEAALPHQVLNARNPEDEAEVIAKAGYKRAITVSTTMAGRGTDIILDPNSRKLGGLHIILAEFIPSHRMIEQLIGRTCRQGEPGSCQTLISFDEEILGKFLNPILSKQLQSLSPNRSTYLYNKIATHILNTSLKKAEKKSRKIRQALVQKDQWLSESLLQ